MRGGTPGLRSTTLTSPRHVWIFNATCAQDQAAFLQKSCSLAPWRLRMSVRLAAAPLATAALRGEKRRDYYADHGCPVYAFRTIFFKTLGGSCPVPCNSSVKPHTSPFLNQDNSAESALPMCTASWPWYIAVNYPACLLLQASTQCARAPGGSRAHSRPLQTIRTRRVGVVAVALLVASWFLPCPCHTHCTILENACRWSFHCVILLVV
jgi:hypothetical protein